MKMSYVSLSVGFQRQLLVTPLKPGPIALYHALLTIKNIEMQKQGDQGSWAASFEAQRQSLALLSGLSESGLVKARDRLKQLGFIDFKSKGYRKHTLYRFIDTSNDNSVAKGNGKGNANSNGKSNDNSVAKGNGNSTPLYRQDKTRGEKNINNTSGKSEPPSHESKPKPKKSKTYDHDSEYYQLAIKLKDRIMDNNPTHRKITEHSLQNWANDIRLMIERDKRTQKQVSNMIDWCQDDDFWKTNIFSGAKLRAQYDKMKAKANSQYQQKRGRIREQEPGWSKDPEGQSVPKTSSKQEADVKAMIARLRKADDST